MAISMSFILCIVCVAAHFWLCYKRMYGKMQGHMSKFQSACSFQLYCHYYVIYTL